MSFKPNDQYFASGSTQLFNCWTPNVTKFDSNSFYNWEEDNQPIHDLEERTYLNWEKLGFPTSSVPGLSLTVSADAVDQCNSRIFTSLSAAVEALPERIRFPVLIEVGSHGDLGRVEIDGLSFGPSGSLEIINRNFAKGYAKHTQASSIDTTTRFANYGLINHVSSFDISATFRDASCMSVSSKVLSSTTDLRHVGNTRSITQFPGAYTDTQQETTRLAVSIHTSNNAFNADPSTLSLPVYEANIPGTDSLIGDVSTVDSINGNELSKGGALFTNGTPGVNHAVSLVYGNSLDSVVIKGCDGPVFFRHFFIDGKNSNEDGVTIINSTNVLLENCASVRNTKNGYLVENSVVTATRGLAAYRNYGFVTGNTRLQSDWADVSSTAPTVDSAAGMRLVNSIMTVSSTIGIEGSDASGIDTLINFSRNANGLVLENSVVKGGITRADLALPDTESHFNTELNSQWGIVATNSIIELDGRLRLHGNARGACLINSFMSLDEMEASFHQHEALKLEGSEIMYGRQKRQVPAYITRYLTYTNQQFQFACNGQDIKMDNSTMIPTPTPGLDYSLGKMKSYGAFGINSSIEKTKKVRLPQIHLTNNSKAKLVHYASMQRALGDGANTIGNGPPVYGLAVAAHSGSHVVMQGSNLAATLLVGPTTRIHSKSIAGAYAGRDSSIEFNGPTVICNFGVDTLAEDNSVITFGPQRDNSRGGLDLSSFDLDLPANHTSVELHSTKACIVANRGSTINMQDIGDFQHNWETSQNGIIALNSLPSYDTSANLKLDLYTSAGSMQFYPNPNDDNDYNADGPGIADVGPANIASFLGNDNFAQEPTHNKWNYYLTPDVFVQADQNDVSAWTGGGVCVRAVGNSEVNALNVNFTCGFWNPSAAIYDTSTGLVCDRTFIWNIADKSVLHAAFLSVSGMHPIDAGYHGPSGVYGSGTGNSIVAYGAPNSTPDTSCLSVLDSYGQAIGNVVPRPDNGFAPLGNQEFSNQGPFRLYLSVPGYANFLNTENGDQIFGAPYQLLSQGYQLSGPVSASPAVSSLSDDIFAWNAAGTARTTTKFHYASAVLGGTANQLILDRSAANVFANAKHLGSGKSGRNKMASIYEAHISTAGEAAANVNKNLGRGFKSSNAFDLGRDE